MPQKRDHAPGRRKKHGKREQTPGQGYDRVGLQSDVELFLQKDLLLEFYNIQESYLFSRPEASIYFEYSRTPNSHK